MSEFWPVAAIMTGAALGFFGVPLWQQRRRIGRWPLPPLVVAVLIAPLAFGLYFQVRTWVPAATSSESPERATVVRLVERLAQNPDDAAGWRMLGRSYVTLGEPAKARDAYLEAWARTAEPDNSLKLALAEAEVLADRTALTGGARTLLEDVLASEPSNPKALWYGGHAALASGRENLARERWRRLLELDPPAEVVSTLRMQFGVTARGARSGEDAREAERVASPDVLTRVAATTAGGRVIKVKVRLGQELAARPVDANATIVIFARAPGGGPPLAVTREPASAVPGEFTLSDTNKMIAGVSLADYPELTVVARLSATGQPIEQPGDWYAEARVAPGATTELVIDRLVQ
jgi:cytochrome c-type biogenesis protein CcmH